MDYCKHFNRNSAYLNTFDQYVICAMIYFIRKFTKFNELYEIIMFEIYCLNTTIYDLVWNYALNHMNPVYFAQIIIDLSTKQDQTHT